MDMAILLLKMISKKEKGIKKAKEIIRKLEGQEKTRVEKIKRKCGLKNID